MSSRLKDICLDVRFRFDYKWMQMSGTQKFNLKTIFWLGLMFGGLILETAANGPPYISTTYPHITSSNSVPVQLEPITEVPESMAVLVQSEEALDAWRAKQAEVMEKWRMEFATNRSARPGAIPPMPGQNNYDSARWMPFKTNLLVDLGPGAGRREILFGFKFKGRPFNGSWSGSTITIQAEAPVVVFTSPQSRKTSQPMIQLKGYVSSDLGEPLLYQLFNEQGALMAEGQGLVNDRYHDPVTFNFTTNYFTCYDIALSSGTNTIVLRGKDQAGYAFTTNFVCVFTTNDCRNPPVFSIDSPDPGGEIAGDSVTIRGPSDDATAKFVGLISANGRTNNLYALVERNGYFWFENVPLALGANQVTITASNVAGYSSSTNFVIYGSNAVRIRMDPVVPDELWQPIIKVVTGRVQPPNHGVWINGVQATVKLDGTWLAKNVPVASSPSGGTALFNMTALSPRDIAKGNGEVKETLTAQATLGTNAMILNASSPACGVFQLHLTETSGRGFILQASTNLVEWTSILTNATPETTYDFMDTNANNYHCRFFRVVPLQ